MGHSRIRDIVATAKKAAKLEEVKYGKKVGELQEQISALREQQRKAYSKKREFGLLSKLDEKGAKEAWEQLPKRRKYDKQNLLAVFSSQDIPQALNGRNWYKNAPEELKDDREILIARASTSAFAELDNPFSPHPDFSIPEPFLGDLEVIRAVAKHCPRALMHNGIPPVMYDDDVVFQAFVDRKPAYWNDYRDDLERVLGRFSVRIRSNAAFMLQAAKVGLNVFPFINGGLPNNKEVCLQLPEVSRFKIPDNALKYVSHSLQADREVVLSFVQHNGLVLKYAAPSYRQDLEIVCAASDSNPTALVHCHGLVKKRLGRDWSFMNNILSRKFWEFGGHFPGLYAMLSADLKLDMVMIVAARKGDCLDVSDLPKELSQDPQFWKDALELNSSFWKDLPCGFKLDVSFARCIRYFDDVDTVKEVMKVHPELSSDAVYWCDVILSSFTIEGDKIKVLIDEIGSGIRDYACLTASLLKRPFNFPSFSLSSTSPLKRNYCTQTWWLWQFPIMTTLTATFTLLLRK